MKAKVIAFLLWASLPCFGQVAVELDCIFRSYRVFGRVMLEVFGSDKIQNMIDSEQSIGLWLIVDSVGEEQLKNALEDFLESKNKFTMVYFPGELLTSYEFDKFRGYKGSKFDYLLLKLNEQEIPIKKKISRGKTKDDKNDNTRYHPHRPRLPA